MLCRLFLQSQKAEQAGAGLPESSEARPGLNMLQGYLKGLGLWARLALPCIPESLASPQRCRPGWERFVLHWTAQVSAPSWLCKPLLLPQQLLLTQVDPPALDQTKIQEQVVPKKEESRGMQVGARWGDQIRVHYKQQMALKLCY